MNWKHWPYWLKGGITGLGIFIGGAIIFSIFIAGSSLCGLNSGLGDSHVCTFAERVGVFFDFMYLILIAPFPRVVNNLIEYRSLNMLVQTDDLSSILLILVGLILVSGLAGYFYGKIRNRHSIIT